ncbi:hypothetical protein CV014_02815 [Nostoc sp. CMAA1605]|uniref:hypothetical protein n=1 Tax=Nostoc sp. CMAA1605 TaxID=2055159 RepID=UPI001FA0DA08|nr:hypothetical protein [Nostoc sp. CMAA1605]MCF4966102.1 hypothetical protein [Nostoc sp. CMAA1605]
MNSPLNIEVKNLDHLGIVAGIIDEIGLVVNFRESIDIDALIVADSALYSAENLLRELPVS